MKKIFSIITLIIFWLLSSAFISTNISSIKDPDFINSIYKKLLVVYQTQNLNSKQLIKNEFKEACEGNNITVVSDLTLFPPTRTYTNEEIKNILVENGIDGLLILITTGMQDSSTYVPPFLSSTRGTANIYRNTLYYNSSTQTFGGFNVQRLTVNYNCYLIDVSTDKIAWMASINSNAQGFWYTKEEKITNAVVEEIINKLNEDQLIANN